MEKYREKVREPCKIRAGGNKAHGSGRKKISTVLERRFFAKICG